MKKVGNDGYSELDLELKEEQPQLTPEQVELQKASAYYADWVRRVESVRASLSGLKKQLEEMEKMPGLVEAREAIKRVVQASTEQIYRYDNIIFSLKHKCRGGDSISQPAFRKLLMEKYGALEVDLKALEKQALTKKTEYDDLVHEFTTTKSAIRCAQLLRNIWETIKGWWNGFVDVLVGSDQVLTRMEKDMIDLESVTE